MENLEPLDEQEYERTIRPMASMNGYANVTIFRNRVIGFEIDMTENLVMGGVGDIRPLKFHNCSFKGNVALGGSTCSGAIEFADCTFEGFLQCFDNTVFVGTNKIKSARVVMESKDLLEGLNVSGTLLVEAKQTMNIKKINVGVENRVGFLEVTGSMVGIVLEDVTIDICELRKGSIGQVMFNRVNMNSAWVTPLDAKNPNVIIWESKMDQFFAMPKSLTGKSLEIEQGSEIGVLKFDLSTYETFKCVGCSISSLEFLGENSDGSSISIAEVKVHDLIFRDMRNKGLMSFREVKLESGGCLTMKMATMGKTDFILCNFEAGTFHFKNSKITEAFMAESDFPRNIVEQDQELFAQEQLAFGQIATAFQKQGDTVRYLEYQSREIEAHYRALRWFPSGIGSFSFTKLSLWLNRVSNNFGRNWVRGIAFSFGIGLVFFYLLVISSSEYSIGWGFQMDGRLVGSFLKFMNPLRFFETEALFRSGTEKPYLTLSGCSYVIDFFSRVLVVYGFYQTIQAFRRYGRSR
jgi:hypothetical protein